MRIWSRNAVESIITLANKEFIEKSGPRWVKSRARSESRQDVERETSVGSLGGLVPALSLTASDKRRHAAAAVMPPALRDCRYLA